MPILIALGFFLAIVMVCASLAMPRTVDPVQNRLNLYGTRIKTLEEIEMQLPFAERAVQPLLRNMALFVLRFAPRANLENLRRRIDMAGNPNNWTPSDFLGVRGLAALGCGAL